MSLLLRFPIFLCFFILSCINDYKVTFTNAGDIEIETCVRTSDIVNLDFSINNPDDIFRVELELYDEQNVSLLEAIEVYLTYKQSGMLPSNELLKRLELDIFTIGQFGKLISSLMITEDINGYFSKTREFRAVHNLHNIDLELPRHWKFTVVDNQIVMNKKQLPSSEG